MIYGSNLQHRPIQTDRILKKTVKKVKGTKR